MRSLSLERADGRGGGAPRRRSRAPVLLVCVVAGVAAAVAGYFGVGIFARLVLEASKCSQ